MGALVLLVLYVAIIWGWVLNIIALIHHVGPVAAFGALEVLRIIGIVVVPLGSILGWFF